MHVIQPSGQPKLCQLTQASHNNPLRCCINNLPVSQRSRLLPDCNGYNPAFDVISSNHTILSGGCLAAIAETFYSGCFSCRPFSSSKAPKSGASLPTGPGAQRRLVPS